MSTTTAPELLSLAHVARQLGVQPRTIRGWDSLPTHRLGGKFYVAATAYEAWLARLKTPGAQANDGRETGEPR